MHVAPYVYVGDKLEIKCLITGDSPYSKMFFYCPVSQLTVDQLCFEDCKKIGDHNNIFNKLDCLLDINQEMKSFIYVIASINESWLAFNNSYFRCSFVDKSAKVPLVILNKKGLEDSILQYIDIIVVMGLLVFSLSINVAFCSWYTQNKKYLKMKKSMNIQASIPLNAIEEKITSNHQRKCRSLDLPQRKEMQQQLLRRNRSVLMLPILLTNKHMSPSPSMSSYNYPFSNEYNPLINKQNKNTYKIDANFNKLNTVLQNNNQTEQVSSFKSAMDNKINENLSESLLN